MDHKIFTAPKLPAKKESKVTKIEPFRLSESVKKEVGIID